MGSVGCNRAIKDLLPAIGVELSAPDPELSHRTKKTKADEKSQDGGDRDPFNSHLQSPDRASPSRPAYTPGTATYSNPYFWISRSDVIAPIHRT